MFVFLWHTGVEISRAFSPESSDSGNETNSSEMTESSELASAQRHSENHLRMQIATTEGYQSVSNEKARVTAQSDGRGLQYNAPEHQEDEAKSSAVASSQIFHSDGGEMEPETMEIKSVSDYFTQLHMGSMMSRQRGKQREAENRAPGETYGSSDKLHTTCTDAAKEEAPHLVGKYNVFTVRDSYYVNQLDLGRIRLNETHQKLQQRGPATQLVESLSPECINEKPDSDDRCLMIKAHLHSPSKGPVPAEGDATTQDVDPQQSKIPMSEQDVTRFYEYHVNKRMSSIQSEGVHSLQSSQCSSIDAGCGTGSSSCATPMDSPLCVTDSMHVLSEPSLKGMTYVIAEDKAYGSAGQAKASHPMDPTLLRRIHAATSAEPGFTIARDGSHRMSKIKETTGKLKQKMFDLLYVCWSGWKNFFF